MPIPARAAKGELGDEEDNRPQRIAGTVVTGNEDGAKNHIADQ